MNPAEMNNDERFQALIERYDRIVALMELQDDRLGKMIALLEKIVVVNSKGGPKGR